MRLPSQLLIDKTMAILRQRIGKAFGQLAREAALEVERRLAAVSGFAK